jgi:hypothetical protein
MLRIRRIRQIKKENQFVHQIENREETIIANQRDIAIIRQILKK